MQTANLVFSIAHSVAVSARLGVDLIDLITQDDISKLKCASLVTRTSILALDLISLIGGETGKISEGVLLNIKGTEMLLRTLEVPIRFSDIAFQEMDRGWTVEGVLRLIEQGIVAPLSGIVSNSSQLEVLQEKIFLKQVQENPDAERPIYEYNPVTECLEQVGSKKIDPKECQDNIDLFGKIRDGANLVTASSEIGALEGIYRVMIRDLFRRHIDRQQRMNQAAARVIQALPAQPIAAAQLPENIVDVDQILDLPSFQRIPQYFEGDLIFSKYVCPISLAPIRHIVRDTTARDSSGNILNCYYEKTEILKYLNTTRHPKSPHSNLPITEDDLVEDPVAQAEIDQRLDFHKNAIINFLGTQLNA